MRSMSLRHSAYQVPRWWAMLYGHAVIAFIERGTKTFSNKSRVCKSTSATPKTSLTMSEGDHQSKNEADSNESSRVVRDFIYLDIDRLNSLYSQVFEGVARSITESIVRHEQRTEETKGTPLSGRTLEEQMADASRQTRSKVLYDHMYNRLEAELQDAFEVPPKLEVNPNLPEVEASDVEGVDLLEGQNFFENHELMRVTGYPVMLDYQELKQFTDYWEAIEQGMGTADQEVGHAARIENLREQVRNAPDRDERTRLKKEISKLEKEREAAFDNPNVSVETMEFIGTILEISYGDAFDVLINREQDSRMISFRGILNRKWLRLSSKRLKALYGGSAPGVKWTMVGRLSYNPLAVEASATARQQGALFLRQVANMRDTVRNTAKGLADFEDQTLRSADSIEFHLLPLAIYRETQI